MRATSLAAAATGAVLILAACDEAAEPPFLAETVTPSATTTPSATPSPASTPTGAPETGGMDGFRAFATAINAALEAKDAQFFIDRARLVEVICSGQEQLGPCSGQAAGAVLKGIPGSAWRSDAFWVFSPTQYSEALDRYFQAAEADATDQYGDGSLSLYALAERAGGEVQLFRAITTSIVNVYPSTGYPIGQNEREAHAFNFEFEAGRWVFTGEIAAVRLVASSDWLSGVSPQCFDQQGTPHACYDHWERWEGSP